MFIANHSIDFQRSDLDESGSDQEDLFRGDCSGPGDRDRKCLEEDGACGQTFGTWDR